MASRLQQRQEAVSDLLRVLSANQPVPSSELAARAGLRVTDVVNVLHRLESNPGPGPLHVGTGWTWVD